MPYLFSYGTLQQENVQIATFDGLDWTELNEHFAAT